MKWMTARWEAIVTSSPSKLQGQWLLPLDFECGRFFLVHGKTPHAHTNVHTHIHANLITYHAQSIAGNKASQLKSQHLLNCFCTYAFVFCVIDAQLHLNTACGMQTLLVACRPYTLHLLLSSK